MRELRIILFPKCQELWCHFLVVSRIDEFYKWVKVRKLQKRSRINVVFVATFLSQWKYQRLYELMRQNPRLNPIILVAPMRHHEASPDYLGLKQRFDEMKVDYIDFDALPESDKDIRKSLKPDILFYIQPYYHIYDKRVDSHSFKDKLLCYSVYFYGLSCIDWAYNLEFHERAWKLFYITNFHKKMASEYAMNKGRNVDVVGYINADLFMESAKKVLDGCQFNVWKPQSVMKKRVIWSPHFSITPDTTLYQGNFLAMAETMLLIAEKYKDSIQFSFKPHPSLYSVLCRLPEWGKERTDAYYAKWENGENTQLDNGEFVDLFMTSDAMINDSGSFTAEYIYTLNPALNCFVDADRVYNTMNDIGKAALKCQYKGSSCEEVEQFLENVVLTGNDTLREKREAFYKQYLQIPYGESVTMNIYNSILKAIG